VEQNEMRLNPETGQVEEVILVTKPLAREDFENALNEAKEELARVDSFLNELVTEHEAVCAKADELANQINDNEVLKEAAAEKVSFQSGRVAAYDALLSGSTQVAEGSESDDAEALADGTAEDGDSDTESVEPVYGASADEIAADVAGDGETESPAEPEETIIHVRHKAGV
jgi:uncharacterized protein YciI